MWISPFSPRLAARLLVFAGLTLAFGLGVSPASAEEAGWSRVSERDGIEVHARSVHGSDVKEVQATTVIDAPPARVFEVLLDWKRFVEFMPYIVEVREVARESPTLWYLYQRISPPLVNERDYTLRHQSVEDPQRGHYELRWDAANDRGPAAREGTVRIELCTGSYVVQGLDSGARTQLTYQLYTDPGGALPTWIANIANRQSVPALLQAIAHRSKDPGWRR